MGMGLPLMGGLGGGLLLGSALSRSICSYPTHHQVAALAADMVGDMAVIVEEAIWAGVEMAEVVCSVEGISNGDCSEYANVTEVVNRDIWTRCFSISSFVDVINLYSREEKLNVVQTIEEQFCKLDNPSSVSSTPSRALDTNKPVLYKSAHLLASACTTASFPYPLEHV